MPTVSAIAVNFSQFQLETHVQKALRLAWALAKGKPVNAAHLLKGAIILASTQGSPAFSKLALLLPIRADVKATDVPPPDLAAFQVTKPIADSFSVAEGFLADGKAVWGRDFVTLALLAKADPSLREIAYEAGADIEVIRREWYEFLRAGDQRRTGESWKQWWRGAGIPLPTDEEPKESTSAAYLFTWNPARYAFADLKKYSERVKTGEPVTFGWSTGNRQHVEQGGRVFLLRQGVEPRGLVGVGEVVSAVREGPHWDEAERREGRKSSLVDVRWSALSPEPFLDLQSLADETGNATIWSTPSGGVALEPEVTHRLEEAWPRGWARHTHGLPDDTLPPVESRQWIARFNADTGAPDDSLKVDRYVDAFARVMASRSLTPPLSIGLFGDWGSGKTFFMDRLFEKVDELAKQEPQENPVYWQRICQMRFNAWHYTETNLWASLVSTIFGELCGFLDGRKSDADEFNRLLNQLELVGELRKEALQRLEDAERQLEDARGKLAAAEQQLAELPPPPQLSDAQLRATLAKSVADVAGADLATIVRLLRSAAEWSGRQDFSEAADRLETGKATVSDVRALLAEAGALASRTGFWWRVLSGAKLHKTTGFWLLIGGMVILLALGFVVARLYPELRTWSQVWTFIGEAMLVAGTTVTWIRSRVAGASAVFDRLGSLQASVERGIEDARNADRLAFEAERDRALRTEQEKKAQVEQARLEAEQASETERQARDAVREATSQARLGRFIRERTSSADYEKHLGLIAMIHRDFRRLSELMETVRMSGTDAGLPRIDRIILYIDDLDRCHPPEKVVRVLEAIHLLLFFPLFIVVVGVDSRWVSRALYKHYEGMLADEAIVPTDGQAVQRSPAQSQDFLEKIFHVPFWLRRMEPAGVQRMIHSLISGEEVETSPAAGPGATVPAVNQTVGPATTASGVEAGVRPGTIPEDPDRAAAKRVTGEAESGREAIGESLAAPSESLRITAVELQFMDEVAPLMPRTPRSVKRFVNIYRLYKAALSPPAFARFLGTPDRPGNFRAVQVLLALVTGTPQFAKRVFQELQNSGNSSARLSALVKSIESVDDASLTTLQALREFAQGKNDMEIVTLREVSGLVSRYSLHHMVSSAPGESGLG